jgi:hypothetical protein
MAWAIDHLLLVTFGAAAAVLVLPLAGFFFTRKISGQTTAMAVALNATASMATAIVLAVVLHDLWAARDASSHRAWTARREHLEHLQVLLRHESDSMNDIARGLRQGRHFTEIANDARAAIWHDDVLTEDVERHFPEYARRREQLIREVLDYDTSLGDIRGMLSASLHLTEAAEPYRSDLIQALVKRCGGGAPDVSFARAASDAAGTYDQYQCAPRLVGASRQLLDRAEDLADTASSMSAEARRHAEETVLHGSCTYAPAEHAVSLTERE